MIQKIFTEDHNKTKAYLAQAREGEERLRKNIKEFERFFLETFCLICVIFKKSTCIKIFSIILNNFQKKFLIFLFVFQI